MEAKGVQEPTYKGNNYYQGVVTNINEDFCLIELDNKWIVMFYKIFKNGITGLPKLNEKISIQNFHKEDSEDVIVLNENSVIECGNYSYSEKTGKFCQAAKKNNFSFADLIFIQKVIKRYKKSLGEIFPPNFLKTFKNITVNNIFLQAFTKLPIKFCEKNSKLLNYHEYEFYFPCTYADDTCPKLDDNEHLPPIAFTTQVMMEKILIGYLCYNFKTFDLVLCDGKKEIKLVQFTDEKSLKNLINNFVVIKDFIYVCEYYKKDNKKLQYIIIDSEDVHVLKFNETNDEIDKTSASSIDNKIILTCEVRNKSYVYSNVFKKDINQPEEVWLHLIVNTPIDITFEVLAFSKFFVENYSIIDVGSKLEIEMDHKNFIDPNKFCERYQYRKNEEINRLVNLNLKAICLRMERIKIKGKQYNWNVDNLESVSLHSKNKAISFTARISEKRETPVQTSRTKTNKQLESFGTIGSQTHTLILTGIDQESRNVKMYLNNFENLKCPLGLIPDMKINVRYALTQNGYLKSCAMTHFEIIEYQPHDVLNVVYDFEPNWNWGEPTSVSRIEKPWNASKIWGRFQTIELKNILYKTKCASCNKYANPLQSDCCQQSTFNEVLHFIFNACDGYGTIKIESTNREVLNLIISNAKDASSPDIIFECMNMLRFYMFNCTVKIKELDESTKSAESDDEMSFEEFKDSLDCFFHLFTDSFTCPLDLRLERCNDLWFCKEARVSSSATVKYPYYDFFNFFS